MARRVSVQLWIGVSMQGYAAFDISELDCLGLKHLVAFAYKLRGFRWFAIIKKRSIYCPEISCLAKKIGLRGDRTSPPLGGGT